MKLVISSQQNTPLIESVVYISSQQNLNQILGLFQANSFDVIESDEMQLANSTNIHDKEFWKLLFSALKQNGDLNLDFDGKDGQNMRLGFDTSLILSLMKLNGFTNVHVSDCVIQAKKPQWQAAGAPLKRKQQQSVSSNETHSTSQLNSSQQQQINANPWASLQSNNAGLINEDELMKDVSETKDSSAFQKFCGEDDKIKAGKPCENCTCGRKELEEGKITEKDLEVGNVESSCGKCYLGDAFRCASCPYLGQPAFEAGDKVKLKNATNSQQQVEREQIQVKANAGGKVVLDL